MRSICLLIGIDLIREGIACYKDSASIDVKRADGAPFTGGTVYQTHHSDDYVWHLTNGACVQLQERDNNYWNGLYNQRNWFIVDVNGTDKRPNQLGKDIFTFDFMPDGRVLPDGHDRTAQQRATDYERCNWYGSYCAFEIINAGWQFPKNYPVRF